MREASEDARGRKWQPGEHLRYCAAAGWCVLLCVKRSRIALATGLRVCASALRAFRGHSALLILHPFRVCDAKARVGPWAHPENRTRVPHRPSPYDPYPARHSLKPHEFIEHLDPIVTTQKQRMTLVRKKMHTSTLRAAHSTAHVAAHGMRPQIILDPVPERKMRR